MTRWTVSVCLTVFYFARLCCVSYASSLLMRDRNEVDANGRGGWRSRGEEIILCEKRIYD